MRQQKLIVLLLAVVLGSSSKLEAAYIPTGIQQNVPLTTITNTWGWSVLYSGDYGNSISIPSVFGGAQQYLMLAAVNNSDPNTVVLAAAALASDVLQVTAFNTTHTANGTNWYYNDLSMGFTPIGSISQNSADTSDAPGFGGNLALGALKLSWHTQGVGGAPTNLNGGWRAGNVTFLNGPPGGTGWTRYVFTAANANDPSAAIPEPASIALFGLTAVAAGCFGWRRRKAVATA